MYNKPSQQSFLYRSSDFELSIFHHISIPSRIHFGYDDIAFHEIKSCAR